MLSSLNPTSTVLKRSTSLGAIKTNFEVYLKNINTVGKNSTQYKESPQSELMSAYTYNASLPLIKKTKKSFNTFEPKLSLRLSPHDMKNNKSLERRIDVNNVFSFMFYFFDFTNTTNRS